MIKRLELNDTDYFELISYCFEKGILFLSSPFDTDSVRFLANLGLEIFKIPSGEITNFPLLREIGKLKKEVLLSTGMADLGEIEDALNVLTQFGTPFDRITVLHCNTEYPTPVKDVNLKAMQTIKTAFQVDVGYSDHTLGIEVPIAAVAMGARVIEKHLTLDRNMEGPDHRASLEPHELKEMVKAIRNIESALGDGLKRPSGSELKNIDIARKSIVASRPINKGEVFSEENICTKRAGRGLSPMLWNKIIGKKAISDFKPDQLIDT
jgi:N,N'-diacetyllegionaminate synthase